MKRKLIGSFALVTLLLLAGYATCSAQFVPNAGEPPPYGVQPPWGRELSINHNQDLAEMSIPYFFPPGEPGNPYDLIWHVRLQIDNYGFQAPATYARMHFILDTQQTHNYYLSCDTGGWFDDFNTPYNQPLLYESSIVGSSASLEWASVNGQAIARAGFWCEEDD